MSLWGYKNSDYIAIIQSQNFSMSQPKAPYYHRKLAKVGKCPRKYRKYGREKRLELIKKVIMEREAVSVIAKRLGIANTTARLIVRTYQEGGHVFQKKADLQKRKLREKREAQKHQLQKEKQVNLTKKREEKEEKPSEVKVEEDSEQASIRPLGPQSEPTLSYQPPVMVPVQVVHIFWLPVPQFPLIPGECYPLLNLENPHPEE